MERPYHLIPPLSSKLKLTPKQAVISAWRRIDLTHEERSRADNTKAAAQVMPSVLQRIGLERKRSDLEVLKVWDHLIDPVVVAHARPVGLVKGTLFVNVDSNAWLNEIVRYRRQEILRRLKHSFGPDLIQRISFRVG
jgi:predicted nucleic acid-binding Zn ribbon protein